MKELIGKDRQMPNTYCVCVYRKKLSGYHSFFFHFLFLVSAIGQTVKFVFVNVFWFVTQEACDQDRTYFIRCIKNICVANVFQDGICDACDPCQAMCFTWLTVTSVRSIHKITKIKNLVISRS